MPSPIEAPRQSLKNLPMRVRFARYAIEKISSLPLPRTLVDPENIREKIAEAAKQGIPHLFIFAPHQDFWDGPVLNAQMYTFPGVGEKEIQNPQSLHQHNERLAKVFDWLFGSPVLPIVNNNTREYPKFSDISEQEERRLLNELVDGIAKSFRNGNSATMSLTAGRSPFLNIDDDQKPVGSLMAALKRKKITDYRIVLVGIAKDQNSKHFTIKLGGYLTADEMLSDAKFYKNVDGYLKNKFLDIIDDDQKQPDTVTSATVVGAAGQTGQVFTRRVAERVKGTKVEAVVKDNQSENAVNRLPESVNVSTDLSLALERNPEALILAIPNPTDEALQIIAEKTKKPLTLILPQNGIDVVPKAQEILGDRKDIALVRASLFTPISADAHGNVPDRIGKLRIGLAPVLDDVEYTSLDQTFKSLQDARGLFLRSGFDVRVFDDYKSMEWTKLVANLVGNTAAITGLTPQETFNDKDIFDLEARGLQDRLRLLEAEGIPFAHIPWQSIQLLEKLQHIPIPILQMGRSRFAKKITKERNNESPAAARKIAEGRPTETHFYHMPFVELATKHGMHTPVDLAILGIMQDHDNGFINLAKMSPEDKKNLLLTTYRNLTKFDFAA